MGSEIEIFWDDPKGLLLRIITEDNIFSKKEIKELFCSRAQKKFPIKTDYDSYFEKIWVELANAKLIYRKENGDIWVEPETYRAIKKHIQNLSEEEYKEFELEWEDDDLIHWLKRELGGDIMSYHYFLGGRKLHNFLLRLVKRSNQIVVMSPYFQEVSLLNQVCEKGSKSYVITRYDGQTEHKNCLQKMRKNNVNIDYVNPEKQDIHGKIIIAEDKIAVVSSYNFDTYSEGKNWEAGIVTYDPEIIEKIKDSIKTDLTNLIWVPDFE